MNFRQGTIDHYVKLNKLPKFRAGDAFPYGKINMLQHISKLSHKKKERASAERWYKATDERRPMNRKHVRICRAAAIASSQALLLSLKLEALCPSGHRMCEATKHLWIQQIESKQIALVHASKQ
jgi:hypothetical protein